MFRVITVTHQCESGGTQLASLVAIGFDRAATLINEAVVFPDMGRTPAAEQEVAPCHLSIQL
jgi:hypothetical protein